VVALTFDAGGDSSGVDAILQTLAKRSAPATFFLTGRFADTQPPIARRIAARYPVGNHTQDHLDLTQVSAPKARTQIRQGATAIKEVTGEDPRPYFRFPMGAVTPSLVRLVNEECYIPIRWTVDTLGWQGTDPDSSSGGMTAAKVVQRVLAGLKPGAIVLMHVGANPDDHTTFDADALPQVIDEVRARGYTLVDLTRLVAEKP
jgi:peptidoglycan-N-acetylglucosamine deacetylase